MARSHSIYILRNMASGNVIGAFTVKHEMETARDRHERNIGPTTCLQYRDNVPYFPEHPCRLSK